MPPFPRLIAPYRNLTLNQLNQICDGSVVGRGGIITGSASLYLEPVYRESTLGSPVLLMAQNFTSRGEAPTVSRTGEMVK